MKIIISPAKTLDFESKLPTENYTKHDYLNQSILINDVLKKLSPDDLSQLMSISSKLGELNWQRNQVFDKKFTLKNARQAIYAFKGDVYLGLDAYSISLDKIDELQGKLRILSGQYGLLKPLDLIQPYRLEMGTSIAINDYKNLYAFWKDTLTKDLNKSFTKDDFLVNLASKEYSSAIDFKQIKVPIITPDFKDYKDGKLKTISFFAKKARGSMVRFILDNDVNSIEDLKLFNVDGYQFDVNLSNEKSFTFTR